MLRSSICYLWHHLIRQQVAHHDPQIRDASLSIRSLKLAFLIDTPYWTNLISDFSPERLARRIDGVGEASCKDNDIELPLSTIIENRLVFGKALDIARLNLDLAINDVCTSSGIEVEAAITSLTQIFVVLDGS